MKTLLLLSATLISLLCSCSKSVSDEDKEETVDYSKELPGIWLVEGWSLKDSGFGSVMDIVLYIDQEGHACKIESEPDMIYSTEYMTYTLSGKNLTFESTETIPRKCKIKKLTNKELILIDKNTEYTVDLRRLTPQEFTEITAIDINTLIERMKASDELTITDLEIEDEILEPEFIEPEEIVFEEPVIISQPAAPAPTPKSEPKPEPEKIFEFVEQEPQFPGGYSALMNWLETNLRYPELAAQNNIEGRVIVQFVVEKDGSISLPVIARGIDKELDKEAIRVIKRMPKWQPGKNNGVAVRTKFTLPITFHLQH